MSLLANLRQRKLVQWAVAYVAAAFALLQGVDIIAQRFAWPDSIARGLIIACCIGFFVTLLLAWYHGEQGKQKVSGTELLILALLLAVGGGLLWKFSSHASVPSTGISTAPQLARIDNGVVANGKSIAVLPFVNMSSDPDNVYFSDGLSEEILNSLARIDGMQVVGRTSSFQFKGRNEDLRVIGEKLGVANVLEGSVRREGRKARITAQLVRTSDGIHLWSETYDRTLDDTLAVQLDIAEKVAGVLDVVLDDKQRGVMHEAGVRNVDAFIGYQKGLKLYNDAHANPDIDLLDGLRAANAQFARATAMEPGFFEPHFAAADLYEHTLQADSVVRAQRADAQRAALRTLGRAATSSRDQQQRQLTLAERQMLSNDWHGLAANIESALKAPGCNASNWLPVFASAFGYADAIEDMGKRASACDPLNFINFNTRLTVAVASGHPQRAQAIKGAVERIQGGTPSPAPPVMLALLGRVDEANRVLEATPSERRDENYYIASVIIGRASGKSPAAIHAALQSVDRKQTKYRLWDFADAVEAAHSGDRAEANRRAAVFDARPAGSFALALLTVQCQCGAPFDLDATPNFKARLAESGLSWPPPEHITYPARQQTSVP